MTLMSVFTCKRRRVVAVQESSDTTCLVPPLPFRCPLSFNVRHP